MLLIQLSLLLNHINYLISHTYTTATINTLRVLERNTNQYQKRAAPHRDFRFAQSRAAATMNPRPIPALRPKRVVHLNNEQEEVT